jgi:Tol biopolymer transport system component
VWSPDGKRIVFDSRRTAGSTLLYAKDTNGSEKEDLIDATPVGKFPTSWSADGRFVLFNTPASMPPTGQDIWSVPVSGDRKAYPFLKTAFNEARAQFSPDGRWIAYQSNESGRFEVYVTPFPGPGGRWQVSAAGGNSPRWRRDGKELFYIAADEEKMMVAAVNGSGPAFAVGAVRSLFSARIRDQFLGIPYDVTADGQHFLVNTTADRSPFSFINLIVNWPALLKK